MIFVVLAVAASFAKLTAMCWQGCAAGVLLQHWLFQNVSIWRLWLLLLLPRPKSQVSKGRDCHAQQLLVRARHGCILCHCAILVGPRERPMANTCFAAAVVLAYGQLAYAGELWL